MDTIAEPKTQYSLRRILHEPPCEAYLLDLPSGFPLPDEEVPALRELIRMLTEGACASMKLTVEVFVQLARLRGATRRFEKHAAQWMPTYGLGVWPDREPPTLWTKADFESLNVGEWPKPLMYKVLRVTGPTEARENARHVMLGLGGVLQVMISEPAETFLNQAKELLLPRIVERSFRIFPFYIPLLEEKSLANAKRDQLEKWLCGATLYWRESPEDRGLFIASTVPLAPLFTSLGGRLQPGSEVEWRIPY